VKRESGEPLALVNRSRLDQLKEARLRFKVCSVGALHVETPGHRSEGRWEWASRGVFEGLARGQRRLFADHAWTMNFFCVAGAVDDRPMTIEELDGRVALVRNMDRVEEEPATRRGVAVLRRIVRSNSNADACGFRLGRCFKEIAFGHGRDSSRHVSGKRRWVRR